MGANRLLHEAKSHPVTLMTLPISVDQLSFCAFSDGLGFGFFATVTGVFCDGALLGGFFATVNSRGFFATVSTGFLRRLEGFFATVK